MKNKTEQGFGVVEGLLVLVLITVLCFIGWFIWQTNRHTVVGTSSPAAKVSSKPKVNTTQVSTNNVYSGWKSYCDSASIACFQYPPDWASIAPLSSEGFKAFGQNETGTINLEYTEPASGQDGQGNFVVKSVNDLAIPNPNLKIIGGYYTTGNVPGFMLVNETLVRQLGLIAGKTIAIGSKTGLYFTAGSTLAELSVHLNNTTGNATLPVGQADSWFSSTDAKLALQIVQSYYVKQI